MTSFPRPKRPRLEVWKLEGKEIDARQLYPDAELKHQLDIILFALGMLEASGVPAECRVCLNTEVGPLLTLCGDQRHGLCVLCMAKHSFTAQDRSDIAIELPQAIWEAPRARNPKVSCPTCRQGSVRVSYTPLSSDQLALKHPLPGFWVQTVYSLSRLTELRDWCDDARRKLATEERVVPQPPGWLVLPPDIKRLHESLTSDESVSCAFRELGCKWESSNNASHRTHLLYCPFRPLTCHHCSSSIPWNQGLKNHVTQECQKVKCNLCDLSGPWSTMKEHIEQHNTLAPADSGLDRHRLFSSSVFLRRLENVTRLTTFDGVRQVLHSLPGHTLAGLYSLYDALGNLNLPPPPVHQSAPEPPGDRPPRSPSYGPHSPAYGPNSPVYPVVNVEEQLLSYEEFANRTQ